MTALRVGESTRGVDAERLRLAMGHFATGVAVVTSLDDDARAVGTTANAITSLSLEPPLVLVCFDRASNTLQAVQKHRAFSINILAEEHRELSDRFARPGTSNAAWERISHRPGATGSPRLPGVLASLDCVVERRIAAGDHEIVIGRVLEVETGAGDGAPLLFYRGRYASAAQR